MWTLQLTTALKHNPVEALNALVRSCLLEERSSDKAYTYHPKNGPAQTLKWSFHNGLGLVFVAVYQQSLPLLYVEELLDMVKKEFLQQFTPNQHSYKQFDETFQKLLHDCETKADQAKRAPQPRSTAAANKAVKKPRGGIPNDDGAQQKTSEDDDAMVMSAQRFSRDSTPQSDSSQEKSDSSQESEEDKNNSNDEAGTAFDVSKLGKRGPHGRSRNARSRSTVADTKPKAQKPADQPKPKTKAARKWNLPGSSDEERLDYSEMDSAPSLATPRTTTEGEEYPDPSLVPSRMDQDDDVNNYAGEEDDEEDEEEVVVNGGSASQGDVKRGLLSSFMGNLKTHLVGKAALSHEDLAPALLEMKRKLMERNVAEGIAQKVCDSVGSRLEGQKLSSLTGVKRFVRTAFEEALNGVLNKRQVDVLRDIQAAKAKGKPYVIVFCGVNGVGKSTNLAKIAYWLLQHNVKVLIAACDTFRAGAVEQLKTHCTRLKVPLYERGYERDPAKVASEAVVQAQRSGCDVVLVDTAGRMQDNEPLMRALSKLIAVNEPNLVLFVGEALVGNDAVDQLVKFNRALQDLAPPELRRQQAINGIVLTKFDTIDDKVGAALNMVYSSGAPIMFVGCGQTYVDLTKLNVKSVVASLLK